MSGPEGPRGPRPVAAFFISLAASAVLLGILLLADRRVFELAEARVRIRQLDQQIEEQRRENGELQAAVESARRQEFPAERVAREEFQLMDPADLVLLYPAGTLSPRPTPARQAPRR